MSTLADYRALAETLKRLRESKMLDSQKENEILERLDILWLSLTDDERRRYNDIADDDLNFKDDDEVLR
jgi:hypothetical protein